MERLYLETLLEKRCFPDELTIRQTSEGWIGMDSLVLSEKRLQKKEFQGQGSIHTFPKT